MKGDPASGESPGAGGPKRIGDVINGISRVATGKLIFDAAHELRGHGIAVVSLYPSLVRRELITEAAA